MRRIRPETAVENYFRTAGEMEARGTLRVADAILSVRFPDAAPPKPAAKRRGPGKKPHDVVSLAAQTAQGL